AQPAGPAPGAVGVGDQRLHDRGGLADRGAPFDPVGLRRDVARGGRGLLGGEGRWAHTRRMSTTGALWRAIEPIYAAILAHPFVRGLTDGSLPREAFRFYAVQDALYLREFARALSVAAARAPPEDWVIMFNEHAAGALKVEMTLHESFFKDFGLSPEEVAATPLAPTNAAYTSYLLAVAYGSPFHAALGALFPGYWIYWVVGKELERRSSPDPLYSRWIGTYASEEFGSVVRAVLACTDTIAA